MTSPTVKQVAKDETDALNKNRAAAEKIADGNGEALNEGANASSAAIQIWTDMPA